MAVGSQSRRSPILTRQTRASQSASRQERPSKRWAIDRADGNVAPCTSRTARRRSREKRFARQQAEKQPQVFFRARDEEMLFPVIEARDLGRACDCNVGCRAWF
jgi:hypothetical protein